MERDPEEVRPLSRDDLAGGSSMQAYLRQKMADVWSEEQLQASLSDTLRHAPPGDVWLFGYGSLIWNPLVPVAEERVAKVHGLHRSFCVRTTLGRGSPENPGLVLGLDRGGVCQGVVLRLEAHHAREELAMVWRREMLTGAYKPKWVKARTEQGAVTAIAFVVNRLNKSYAGHLDDDELVRVLSSAGGFLGACTEYLQQTLAGLATRGISDPGLEKLARRCDCAPGSETPSRKATMNAVVRPRLQPGPDHPITVEPFRGRVVVKVAGTVIANSTGALTLREAKYPAVQYIPRSDVDMTKLERTGHATYCPYKGECNYFSIPLGGDGAVNAVWTYENPYDAVVGIKDHVAFYATRVESIEEFPD